MKEKEFNISLMAPVQLSLATSKIAVDKLQNESLKEFAGFELAETTAIASVLKELGTLVPEMNEEAKTLFDEIDSTSSGSAFDKIYIESQLKNHKILRDLTEDYLREVPTNDLDKEEAQSKYVATLLLPILNEHVAVTEKLSKSLT